VAEFHNGGIIMILSASTQEKSADLQVVSLRPNYFIQWHNFLVWTGLRGLAGPGSNTADSSPVRKGGEQDKAHKFLTVFIVCYLACKYTHIIYCTSYILIFFNLMSSLQTVARF
jgi:hypothetical protein